LTFENLDLLNLGTVKVTRNCDSVYHLAADPEVHLGTTNPRIHYEQNVVATHDLPEAIRKTANVKRQLFTSSSTVYCGRVLIGGENTVIHSGSDSSTESDPHKRALITVGDQIDL